MVERKLPKLKTRVRFPSPAPNPMPASFDGKLVVAISSRALFDLEESNRIFEEQGVNAYYRYQLEHENEILAPGIAFALRSEEHTSELQSQSNLVCRLLLEKKKKTTASRPLCQAEL